MTPHRLPGQRGFVLSELVVAIAVIALVMAGIFTVQRAGQEAYLLGSNRVETQQNARVALHLISRELRTARSITSVSGTADITFVDQSGATIRYCWSSSTTSCSSSGSRRVLNRTIGSTVTPLIGGVLAFTLTAYSVYDVSTATYTTTTTADQVRVIRIGLVTKTEQNAAAGSAGDQHATMESTVQLRRYLS